MDSKKINLTDTRYYVHCKNAVKSNVKPLNSLLTAVVQYSFLQISNYFIFINTRVVILSSTFYLKYLYQLAKHFLNPYDQPTFTSGLVFNSVYRSIVIDGLRTLLFTPFIT